MSNKLIQIKTWCLLFCCVFLVQCSNKQSIPQAQINQSQSSITYDDSTSSDIRHVLGKLKSYLGTRYRFGGNDHSGIDCSGLVKNSFADFVALPRASYQQAEQGRNVRLSRLKVGDVVFFRTEGNKRINHAGVVSAVDESTANFIHASSSRGVIISSMDNHYWSKHFVKARRFLD